MIPRAKGGETTWENCVLSCVPCNARKANFLLHEVGMKLLKKPIKPKINIFKADMVRPIKSWQNFLDVAYWNVELEG